LAPPRPLTRKRVLPSFGSKEEKLPEIHRMEKEKPGHFEKIQ
jgi:hypothetical protein